MRVQSDAGVARAEDVIKKPQIISFGTKRPMTGHTVPYQQQSAQRCQVVGQLAISARVHVADEQRGCFL
jgi:hypothetical protein